MWKIMQKIFVKLICINSHMIIYVKTHEKIFNTLLMYQLTHDN
jgi:hypothetical protein